MRGVTRRCHTDRAGAHVAAMQLDERVKACLQRKKFVLPQQARDMVEHFCNECAKPTIAHGYPWMHILVATYLCCADLSGECAYPTQQTGRHECVPLRRRAVYGKLNYISVSGIVRLDASVAPDPIAEGSAKPTFDVWPTPQAKAAASFGLERLIWQDEEGDDSSGIDVLERFIWEDHSDD